jgi:hypothetical protein
MLDTAPVATTAPEFEDAFRGAFEPMVRALTVASGSSVAEDCVQEAFARAFIRWRRIRDYDDGSGHGGDDHSGPGRGGDDDSGHDDSGHGGPGPG